MKDNVLETNVMLQMLCDDIYIAYKTLGTSSGLMYTTARQSSNGEQHVYMCSEITNNDSQDINNLMNLDVAEEQEEIHAYIPTQEFLSPFLTNTAVTLMREISGMPCNSK
jgi:hypothetical protein